MGWVRSRHAATLKIPHAEPYVHHRDACNNDAVSFAFACSSPKNTGCRYGFKDWAMVLLSIEFERLGPGWSNARK